jgi:hypothetical protein
MLSGAQAEARSLMRLLDLTNRVRPSLSYYNEYVQNLGVRKHITLKALDDLVHSDAGLASIFLGHCKRFDMGIELTHCRVQ